MRGRPVICFTPCEQGIQMAIPDPLKTTWTISLSNKNGTMAFSCNAVEREIRIWEEIQPEGEVTQAFLNGVKDGCTLSAFLYPIDEEHNDVFGIVALAAFMPMKCVCVISSFIVHPQLRNMEIGMRFFHVLKQLIPSPTYSLLFKPTEPIRFLVLGCEKRVIGFWKKQGLQKFSLDKQMPEDFQKIMNALEKGRLELLAYSMRNMYIELKTTK